MADPFYSEANIKRLRESIAAVESGEAAFIDGSKIEACANKYAFCGKHQK